MNGEWEDRTIGPAGTTGQVRMLLTLEAMVAARKELTVQTVKALHGELLGGPSTDPWEPFGDWKRKDNYVGGKPTSRPEDVPRLMDKWIDAVNTASRHEMKGVEWWVKLHHSFVAIHPFCDGNGRMARALSSVPRRMNGESMIRIPGDREAEYKRAVKIDLSGSRFAPSWSTEIYLTGWRYDCTIGLVEEVVRQQKAGERSEAGRAEGVRQPNINVWERGHGFR